MWDRDFGMYKLQSSASLVPYIDIGNSEQFWSEDGLLEYNYWERIPFVVEQKYCQTGYYHNTNIQTLDLSHNGGTIIFICEDWY